MRSGVVLDRPQRLHRAGDKESIAQVPPRVPRPPRSKRPLQMFDVHLGTSSRAELSAKAWPNLLHISPTPRVRPAPWPPHCASKVLLQSTCAGGVRKDAVCGAIRSLPGGRTVGGWGNPCSASPADVRWHPAPPREIADRLPGEVRGLGVRVLPPIHGRQGDRDLACELLLRHAQLLPKCADAIVRDMGHATDEQPTCQAPCEAPSAVPPGVDCGWVAGSGRTVRSTRPLFLGRCFSRHPPHACHTRCKFLQDAVPRCSGERRPRRHAQRTVCDLPGRRAAERPAGVGPR